MKSKLISPGVILAILIVQGCVEVQESGTDDIVIIDSKAAAYTVFMNVPGEKLEAAKAQFGKEDLTVITLKKFRKNPGRYIKARIVRNEYPDSKVVRGILALVERFPGIPIGLTWNGGLAITYNDYRHAERTYQRYQADPSGYDRTGPLPSRLDPVNPKGHLGPLLGW